VSCAAARPLGWFFGTPELPAVVIAMSTTFVISGFRTVPASLLQRDLEFKRLALIDGVQTVVLSLGTLAAALLGFGYWTLVVGAILSAMVSTLLAVVQRPFPFERPSAAPLRQSMTFGGHILLQRLSWFAYSDSDFLVVGKLIGREALGGYTFAWTLANVPIEKVTSLITAVTPAIFSAAQHDRAALRRYLLTISEAIAYITLPTTIGLAFVAPELVQLVLGDRWLSMIAPLQLLALYAGVRSLTPLLMQLANVIDEAGFGARVNFAAAVALPLSFLVGSRWGTTGVALAWMLVHPIAIVVPMTRRVFARLDLRLSTYLIALWPAISATAVMAAAVFAVGTVLPSRISLGARLAAEIVAGAGGYGALLATMHGGRLRSFLATWKAIRA
jgi:PST family polysaccharide transporter